MTSAATTPTTSVLMRDDLGGAGAAGGWLGGAWPAQTGAAGWWSVWLLIAGSS
jgi:hypothetical protein